MPNTSGYIPEEIAVILRTQVHDKDALDRANSWLIAELLEGRPDLTKWDRGPWLEAMQALERRIQQAYKSLDIGDELASSGNAVKVFKPAVRPGKKSPPRRKFNDGQDDNFDDPQTLEQLVLQRCGEDSDEWQAFGRLKGLFGVAKPVELKVVDDEDAVGGEDSEEFVSVEREVGLRVGESTEPV